MKDWTQPEEMLEYFRDKTSYKDTIIVFTEANPVICDHAIWSVYLTEDNISAQISQHFTREKAEAYEQKLRTFMGFEQQSDIAILEAQMSLAKLAFEKIREITLLRILAPNEVDEIERIATQGVEQCASLEK